MLEYDLGVLDDHKEAVASVVDKLFGRHVFQTLRTQMQVSVAFYSAAAVSRSLCFCRPFSFLNICHTLLSCSSATSLRAGSASTSRSIARPSSLCPTTKMRFQPLNMNLTHIPPLLQIGFQRVLVQSSLHPPAHVVEHVLAAADVFSKVLMDMPECDVADTAHAFANKMREPDQTVYEKSERIADEVQRL